MQRETNNEFILKRQTYLIWNLSDSDWPEKVPGHLRNTCVSTCVVLFHAAWVYSCECISQVVIVIFPLVSSDLSPLCGLLLPSCCCIDLLPSQRSIKFNPTPSDLIWAPFSFLCVVTVLTTLLSCFLCRWWLSRRRRGGATCGRSSAASSSPFPSPSPSSIDSPTWREWRERRCRWDVTASTNQSVLWLIWGQQGDSSWSQTKDNMKLNLLENTNTLLLVLTL